MKIKGKFGLIVLLLLSGLIAAGIYAASLHPDILNPSGIIGTKEHRLIIISFLLTMIVVVPVFMLTFYIVLKFHEDNQSAKYSPEWDHSILLESIWWGLPLIIIAILAVITWDSSHQLDPSKPIVSDKKPLNVQVVALQWKWLFIYPEQKIASVNYLQMPVNTPVNFQITSDAPMNSFWIPKLGGQIYAMSGMSTQLHLMANQQGVFNGSSANISGRGFAGMDFKAQAVTNREFKKWTNLAQRSNQTLTYAEYTKIAQPSENNQAVLYSDPADNLYDRVMLQYMNHGYHVPMQTYASNQMEHSHAY
jgi:cytochrome o ubiquinol oxidase subunit 2